ncbi:hypothetical protein [Pontibacillus marinus]|uniref:Uncharacterized protein n=1 Tax=Pontibacillus marinus BH030004 = DSM 16465 TaxID=1385511 RepID=A0A0A5G8W1_9BACI|nr:hypothetical protein [Pontibacillus marinus]KGX89581.1 hypothetical protein N783_05415 [Pontibacillus marinus BH030004 = DSM 16465]
MFKRKPSLKEILFFGLVLTNIIIEILEATMDIDLFWLFSLVTVAIVILGFNIYGKSKDQ